jgi:hypothetical protein
VPHKWILQLHTQRCIDDGAAGAPRQGELSKVPVKVIGYVFVD